MQEGQALPDLQDFNLGASAAISQLIPKRYVTTMTRANHKVFMFFSNRDRASLPSGGLGAPALSFSILLDKHEHSVLAVGVRQTGQRGRKPATLGIVSGHKDRTPWAAMAAAGNAPSALGAINHDSGAARTKLATTTARISRPACAAKAGVTRREPR